MYCPSLYAQHASQIVPALQIFLHIYVVGETLVLQVEILQVGQIRTVPKNNLIRRTVTHCIARQPTLQIGSMLDS